MALRIVVLGASGMAGHVIGVYLRERGHDVLGISREILPVLPFNSVSVDLAAPDGLAALEAHLQADVVINCVGVLPRDSERSPRRAIYLNAYLPQYLAEFLRNSPARLIHLSTDCVFSGENPPYAENAFRDGDSVYDRSKALGEFSSPKDLVLRQSIIGPEVRREGTGLLHWFLQQSGRVPGYKNAVWNGVTTLTLAKGIDEAIRQRLGGLYQLVTGSSISKHDLLWLFADSFATSSEVVDARMPVSLDKSLLNTRSDFAFVVPSLKAQIEELADWMLEHRTLYARYSNVGWESIGRRRSTTSQPSPSPSRTAQ